LDLLQKKKGKWDELAPENAQTHLVIYPKSMMVNVDQ
jgi:hypothetical protein